VFESCLNLCFKNRKTLPFSFSYLLRSPTSEIRRRPLNSTIRSPRPLAPRGPLRWRPSRNPRRSAARPARGLAQPSSAPRRTQRLTGGPHPSSLSARRTRTGVKLDPDVRAARPWPRASTPRRLSLGPIKAAALLRRPFAQTLALSSPPPPPQTLAPLPL
jgi:hypothetical protein